jgi:N-acetyl-anhydromuramyl-L-alanine amidase AmpD
LRNINLIVVHCSATPPSADIGADEIRQWHKERGFHDIGYHYVIRRNGTLEIGRDVAKPGAHAKGHNAYSVGICLVGGVDKNGAPDANFTLSQYRTLYQLLFEFDARDYPEARSCGHRDLPDVKKACPCFDVGAFIGRS